MVSVLDGVALEGERVADRRSAPGRNGLTSNDLGTLEVLVRMKIARGQRKPEPDEEEKQVGATPHVDVGFFLLAPAQETARPCLCF